jgi:hypothetical protein
MTRQEASEALSLYQHVQIVAHGRTAHAPIERLQDGDLSQLELLRADVKKRSVFPRIRHRAINNELETLHINMSGGSVITSGGDAPRGGLQQIKLLSCVEKARLRMALTRGCKRRTDAAVGLKQDRREFQ